ncbi:hypothetical protein PoB_004092000 [Plakobranchus ocellatus]|uniref:Uncharacterized protein n=1 Tax=Plakobranchus ocellatus TaxID=259542 RepID=A0AAV4B5T6_9GAST|nr:hypothetical protein PoB_004092000 [Plakobranchus ocellatus]
MDRTAENTVESSKKREDQGNHECEVWICGETFDHRQELNGEEGSREWEKCEKNPGHKGFISAPDFSLLHLPEEYRTQEILDLVQAQADLTVRLRVGYTSANRPDGYPFSGFRGRYIPHTGTGVVTVVCHEQPGNFSDSSEDDYYSDEEEKEDDRDEETKRRDFEAYERASRQPLFTGANCPCHDCEDTRYFASLNQTKPEENEAEGAIGKHDKNHSVESFDDDQNKKVMTTKKLSQNVNLKDDSSTSKHPELEACISGSQEKPCWLVIIETALHVVYDTDEAKHTVVDVFYDRNERTERPQSLYGFSVERTSIENDHCTFKCCTHNEDLVRKLTAASNKRRHIARSLGPAISPFTEPTEGLNSEMDFIPTPVSSNTHPTCSSNLSKEVPSPIPMKKDSSSKMTTPISHISVSTFTNNKDYPTPAPVKSSSFVSSSPTATPSLTPTSNSAPMKPPVAGTSVVAPIKSSADTSSPVLDNNSVSTSSPASSTATLSSVSCSDLLSPTTAAASPPASQARMAVIIGHPHGRSKTVSIGQWMERVKESEYKEFSTKTYYIYNTPTCKGNSGGSVMTFGKVEEERATVVIFTHHHRASCETPGLNMSSPFDELKPAYSKKLIESKEEKQKI